MLVDVCHGIFNRVSEEHQIKVSWCDSTFIDHQLDVVMHFGVVFETHYHYREVCYFPCLYQCNRLEEFVECAKTTRKNNKGMGVLGKQNFAHKKVFDIDPFI